MKKITNKIMHFARWYFRQHAAFYEEALRNGVHPWAV